MIAIINNEEVINLIKEVAQKGQFSKIASDEMKLIYHQGVGFTLSRPNDTELLDAVSKFRKEIQRREEGTSNANTSLVEGYDYMASKNTRFKTIIAVIISIGILTVVALTFRHEEGFIKDAMYRYDRFTSTVEIWRTDEKGVFRWIPLPKFRNLQHVRDLLRTPTVGNGGSSLVPSRDDDQKQRDMQDNIESLRRNSDEQKVDRELERIEKQGQADQRMIHELYQLKRQELEMEKERKLDELRDR